MADKERVLWSKDVGPALTIHVKLIEGLGEHGPTRSMGFYLATRTKGEEVAIDASQVRALMAMS